jgi:hypothetical protein
MIPEIREYLSRTPDLTFYGSRIPNKQRVDGRLSVVRNGRSWSACSGSTTLLPLPVGRYLAWNVRARNDAAMVRGGVGFSVDLVPLFPTSRSLLRIHPDGNVPGTQGCVGITDVDVSGCYDAFKWLLPGQREAVLHVWY